MPESADATVLMLLLPRTHGGNPGAPLCGRNAPSRRGSGAGGEDSPAARLGPGWYARHIACAPNLPPG